jgi:DnaJ-domain-containing protein 1
MQILRLAEVKLRLPEGYTDREVGSLHDSRKHAAEVLGVSEAASKDEIQKAYRSKCKEMHPDALRRHGLPDELIKHAAVQIQSFTEARNVMLAAFN